MPKRAPYQLRWRPEAQTYAIFAGSSPVAPGIVPGSRAWFTWLDEVASFSFHNAAGEACTVRKETVQRGGAYWYAYRRVQGRMAKRYLGRGADLTPAHLEAAVAALRTAS